MVCSGYPDVHKSMAAILLQADEVLVKPFAADQLPALMAKKRLTHRPAPGPAKESVASILDRDVALTIQHWLSRVEQIAELSALSLSAAERTKYLPAMMASIAARLRGRPRHRSEGLCYSGGRSARTNSLRPRLLGAPDRAGISAASGLHLRDHRAKSVHRGLYQGAARHHDYCRRGGLSVEAGHWQLLDSAAGSSFGLVGLGWPATLHGVTDRHHSTPSSSRSLRNCSAPFINTVRIPTFAAASTFPGRSSIKQHSSAFR